MLKSVSLIILAAFSSVSLAKEIANCQFRSTGNFVKNIVITDDVLKVGARDLVFHAEDGNTIDFDVAASVRPSGEFIIESLRITEGYKMVSAHVRWGHGKDLVSVHPQVSMCAPYAADCDLLAEIHCYYK